MKKQTIAERKAGLGAQLHALCARVPEQVNSGGVLITRAWLKLRKRCLSAADRPRSSRQTREKMLAQMQDLLNGKLPEEPDEDRDD